METRRTKGGEGGSRWNQREQRIIAHFILSPAEQRAHQLWHFHAAPPHVRAHTCTPTSVSSGKNKTKKALWPFELLIVFLGPDRLNTLKHTLLTHAHYCRNTHAMPFPQAAGLIQPLAVPVAGNLYFFLLLSCLFTVSCSLIY